jgi:hypothetical protein
VYAIPESSFKAVAIEERKKELEVLFLAVVGSGRHEKKMTGYGRKKAAELETFCIVYFSAKKSSRHLMRFIADYKIPTTIWGF